MAKKQIKQLPAVPKGPWLAASTALGAALFTGVVCLMSTATVKQTSLLLVLLALSSVFLFYSRLRDRMGGVLLLLAAFTVMGGVSTFYAVSGKFALYEFLKLLCAMCLALVLLAFAPEEGAERWIAKVLAGYAATAGLVSIDLLSTRFLSGFVLRILSQFTTDYTNLGGVEAGVRMTSLFANPNVFAGVSGLGVLLSLGLAATAEKPRERAVQTAVLFVNSLAFLLAFSMGATGAVAASFLMFLALERKSLRANRLILMVETLTVTVLAAALISMTSFQTWTGIQPVPMLCVALGVAALVAADRYLGQKLAERLAGRRRLVPVVMGVLVAALAVFVLAAYRLTGGTELSAGASLRRAAYPDPGTYTLSVQSDRPLTVVVESQDQRETMMHTSTVLYQGPAAGAAFTVPEDSLVVYFNFNAPQGAAVEAVTYDGGAGSGSVPLGYKLLPGFIANRLQGLWANENAIQRFVFFSDGLKLFRRSPIVGLGLGAFENGVKSVQSFYYETKYAHNHYIQTLAETGIIGFLLFLLLLGGSAAAVFFQWRRGEEAHPLTATLGAALVFMAVHGAVEVVFSTYAYLPIAFGTFALLSLCCSDAAPARVVLGKKGKTALLLSSAVLIGVFGLLLGGNLYARSIVYGRATLEAMDEGVRVDCFEWADYALSYVDSVGGAEVDEQTRARADAYALRLGKLDSNTVPIHLASYYFETGRPEEGLAMVVKYVSYVSSDPVGWQQAFDLLEQYAQDTDTYRAGVLQVAQILEAWNAENMGQITVDEEARAFIAAMAG